MKLSTEVDEECLQKALINVIVKHVMQGEAQHILREYVRNVINEPEMAAKLNEIIIQSVRAACTHAGLDAARETKSMTARIFSNKGWCEKHGTVPLIPGCEFCAKESGVV